MAKKKAPAKKPVKKPARKPVQSAPTRPERTQTYSDEVIIAALRASHGMIRTAARMLGCVHQTVYNRVKSTPAIREVMLEERFVLADSAESNVFNAVVDEKDIKVSMWVLERLKRNRFATLEKHHIGGDKNAPPIKTEAEFSIDDLPLELRIAILEAMERKDAGENTIEGTGSTAPEPQQGTTV